MKMTHYILFDLQKYNLMLFGALSNYKILLINEMQYKSNHQIKKY